MIAWMRWFLFEDFVDFVQHVFLKPEGQFCLVVGWSYVGFCVLCYSCCLSISVSALFFTLKIILVFPGYPIFSRFHSSTLINLFLQLLEMLAKLQRRIQPRFLKDPPNLLPATSSILNRLQVPIGNELLQRHIMELGTAHLAMFDGQTLNSAIIAGNNLVLVEDMTGFVAGLAKILEV